MAQEADSVASLNKKSRLKGAVKLVDSLKTFNRTDSLLDLDSTSGNDSLNALQGDSLSQANEGDSLLAVSKDAVSSPVDYYAEDSIVFDIKNKKSYLHDQVEVKYEDINLTSNYMEIDFDKNELFARGVKDSAENLQGNPVFKQNQTEFKSEEMNYNFNSKKGLVKHVITQESDGFLHGETVKKMNDSVNFVYKGSFTTCNLPHPHYGFNFRKAKVIANDKIVTGPIQLHIADVPTPLVAPFSMIPNQKGHKNGILIPTYGESADLGFYFQGIGFYAAFYDMVDFAITGDIYTRGSFAINAKSNYIKRYKFSGYIDASYSNSRSGERTTPSYEHRNDFKLTWKHSQDAKAHPRNRFSADVNFITNSYNERNNVKVEEYVNTNFTSAISFSTSWRNNFSLGVNADLSQNVQTKIMQLTLPNINFNISQFYPLRRREVIGKLRWYENISMSYNAIITNRMSLDTTPLNQQIPDKMASGISHAIPISSTIKILKHLDWNNTINMNEYWQFKGVHRQWKRDTSGNAIIVRDTAYDFFATHDLGYTSTLRTTLYGMYSLKKGKVKAFRHEFVPALSFNYRPAINAKHFESYYDSINKKEIVYSPTEVFLYGRPLEKQSAILTLSFSNKLEMKVSDRKDSLGGTKKITLIENLTVSSSYNFTADDSIIFRWQPLTISGRTTILKVLYINFSAGLDPYIIGSQGRKVDTFEINANKRLFRFSNTSWSLSLNYVLNEQTFKRKNDKQKSNDAASSSSLGNWSINISYSFNYSLNDNPGYYNIKLLDSNKYNKKITNTLNLSGNIQFTKKWRLGFTTGYDFTNKMISVSSFDIYRDLHCWEMFFKWRPFGGYRGFEFGINVKSGMLKDLKYNVDKDYREY